MPSNLELITKLAIYGKFPSKNASNKCLLKILKECVEENKKNKVVGSIAKSITQSTDIPPTPTSFTPRPVTPPTPTSPALPFGTDLTPSALVGFPPGPTWGPSDTNVQDDTLFQMDVVASMPLEVVGDRSPVAHYVHVPFALTPMTADAMNALPPIVALRLSTHFPSPSPFASPFADPWSEDDGSGSPTFLRRIISIPGRQLTF